MIDEAESILMKSVVNVSVDHNPEGIQKRFLSPESIRFGFGQDGAWLQKLHNSYRISGYKGQVVERHPFSVIRLLGNIFKPMNFAIEGRHFHKPCRSVACALERERNYISLTDADKMQLQISCSFRWNKADDGSVVNRIGNDPSAFRVSSCFRLPCHDRGLAAIHQPREEHHEELQDPNSGEHPCKPNQFPLSGALFLGYLLGTYCCLVAGCCGIAMAFRFGLSGLLLVPLSLLRAGCAVSIVRFGSP